MCAVFVELTCTLTGKQWRDVPLASTIGAATGTQSTPLLKLITVVTCLILDPSSSLTSTRTLAMYVPFVPST